MNPDSIKTSVLGDALAATQAKASSVASRVNDAFATSYQAVSGSPAPSGLPSWLMPLALVAAIGYVAVKWLPKLFKKGRGTRSVTRR
jgi:hypothetical protein